MSPPADLLALLAAYKVNPDDAVRGLVLADWLEEHGDPVAARVHRRLWAHLGAPTAL